MDPSLDATLTDDDHLLDPRVWKVIFNKQRDGSIKRYYLNLFTKQTFEFLLPDQKRSFTDEEITELQQRWNKNLSKVQGTLFGSGFARVQNRTNEEESNENEAESTMVVIEQEDVMDIQPPEEVEEEEEPVNAIRDTLSRKHFERTVGKTKKFIVDRCAELGIPIVYTAGPKQGRVMTVDDIWIVVDKFFRELHNEQGTQYFESACFQADEQHIVRTRQGTTSSKRKAASGDHKGVHPEKKQRNKNKKLLSMEELKEFESDYIYCNPLLNDKFEVRCRCKFTGK